MLQPGTLTSTSLGRVRVSSAVCAITSPPGSPPERHYTQVQRVLPPEHARPRPNPPRDTPPRTLVSPHPVRVGDQLLRTRLYQSSIPIQKGQQFEASLTAPSLAAFPARLAPSFARLSGSSTSATNSRSRASPTASARPTISLTASCLPRSPPRGRTRLEDRLAQSSELGVLRVPQREPDASPTELRSEPGSAAPLFAGTPRRRPSARG